MLATDGILETFFPIYIKNNPVNIHVSLAQFFMDNHRLELQKHNRDDVEERIVNFLQSIPAEQVNDDKTVAVLINTATKINPQPAAYYEEPDWVELKRKHDEAWRKEAYPSMFNA